MTVHRARRRETFSGCAGRQSFGRRGYRVPFAGCSDQNGRRSCPVGAMGLPGAVVPDAAQSARVALRDQASARRWIGTNSSVVCYGLAPGIGAVFEWSRSVTRGRRKSADHCRFADTLNVVPSSLPRVDSSSRGPGTRVCAKPACSQSAVAAMSYDYARRTVFLGSMAEQRSPSIYDLCAKHVQSLSLPRGWTIRRDRLVGVERRAS